MFSFSYSRTLIIGLSFVFLVDFPHFIRAQTVDPNSIVPLLPVTADICNTSLITSIEGDEDAVLKKCACDTFHVDCSNLGVTELAKLISFPKDIHVATFAYNKIANLNQDTFYSGRGLTELDLSNNRIDFVSVKTFQAFKGLKRLILSHNRLWNVPTKAFQDLTDLKRLDLSFNDLMNVLPELFSPLTELSELHLQVNPLEELEPKHFEHLQKLESLNLQSTMLESIPDHIFIFTPKLKSLNLAGNQLTKVPTPALQVLDHVKVLHLSANPIEVIHSEAFKGMTGLVNLHLDNMPMLKKIDKYAFGDMIHLEELHCSYNFLLSEIDENAFVRKINNHKVALHQLFLRQNRLNSVPQSLMDWDDEIELHVNENPLNCDCHVEWMVYANLKNDFQRYVTCANPGDYENLPLSQLKGQSLTCGLHLSEVVMIACLVITSLLILSMIVAFLLWRRNYTGYSKPRYHVSKKRYVNDVVYTGCEDGI